MKAEEQLAQGLKLPEPPKHLSAALKRFWTHVVGGFELESHHLQLLEQACSQLDRADRARRQLAKDGDFVQGRYGLRAHPAVAVARDAEIAAARLLRELDLDA